TLFRSGVVEGPASHQGRDDGDVRRLGQPQKLLLRLRADDPTADVEHRALRFGDHPRRLADLLGMGLEDRTVAGQRRLIRPDERNGPSQRVLRNVDENGYGTAGGGDVVVVVES